MAWVYILRCTDNTYYVGSTIDTESRLVAHQRGTIPGCYTASRRPVELVFCEEANSLEDAFRWERQLKGWSRRKKEALIAGRYDLLPGLSRSHSSYRPKQP